MGNDMGSRAHAAFTGRALMLIIAACVTACTATPNPASAGTDTAWHGNLTKGGKFGAAIGQPVFNAQQEMLAAGYGFEGEFACSSDILHSCLAEARYLKFQPVQLGQRGHIYLRIENGVISQIIWELTPVAYLDS
jgi:hypothetical protein